MCEVIPYDDVAAAVDGADDDAESLQALRHTERGGQWTVAARDLDVAVYRPHYTDIEAGVKEPIVRMIQDYVGLWIQEQKV
jgi:hypothetical protein